MNLRGRVCGCALGLSILGLSRPILAQEPPDRVVYKKKTVIDLSGGVIEGELTRPEGSYIVNRKLSRFSRLIQARQNYVPELLNSYNDL